LPFLYPASPIVHRTLSVGLFTKEDFIYEPEKDCYRCPAGKELSYRFNSVEQGRGVRSYEIFGGNRCELKSKCSTNKRGRRRITRWVDEAILEAMARRIEEAGKGRAKEVSCGESFGTIKRVMIQGYFLMRGLTKVGAETKLDDPGLQSKASDQYSRCKNNDGGSNLGGDPKARAHFASQ
jgi:hypothetical protein